MHDGNFGWEKGNARRCGRELSLSSPENPFRWKDEIFSPFCLFLSFVFLFFLSLHHISPPLWRDSSLRSFLGECPTSSPMIGAQLGERYRKNANVDR